MLKAERSIVFAAGLGLVLALGACAPDTGDHHNLILITMDTTRADHLGCYGRSVGSTPNIDQVAAKGTVFDRAFSVAPITGPSHASILTGTYPPYHLMRDNGASVLAKGLPTLAELFRARGFATAGIVAAYPVKGIFGFSRGFDYFSDNFDASAESIIVTNLPAVGVERREGEKISSDFLAWFERHDDEPFFAWLHYYDPHMPYEAPEEFTRLFPGEPYDAEIASMDHNIGRVLRAVAKRGLTDQTAVVILSDHGEGLGEHNELTHAILAYNSTIRIPLIIDIPWITNQPARTENQVSTVDLVPTLIDVFGLDRDTEGLRPQGRSLAATLENTLQDNPPDDRLLYFESMFPYLHYRWGTLRGVITGPWKLIAGPDREVFNIAQDFDELQAIADPVIQEKLDRLLAETEDRISADRPEPIARSLDWETRKNLEALGYLGGPSKDTDIDSLDISELAIPRNQIDEWRLFSRATSLARSNELADAVKLAKEIIAANPQHKDAKLLLASVYMRTRDLDSADRVFEELLEAHPELDVFYPAARYFLRVRQDFPRAVTCFLQYLELSPDDHEALTLLGSALEKDGRPEAAVDAYRRALRANPKSRDALIKLGIYQSREGLGPEEARMLLTRAVELYPFDPVTNFNLGIFLAKSGRGREAADLLLRASAFSEHGVFPQAHFALAAIADRQGDPDQADEYLRDIIRTAQDPVILKRATDGLRSSSRSPHRDPS